MDRCSFWQIRAAIEGWGKANGAEEPVAPPTGDEHDEIVRRYYERQSHGG